MTRRFAAFVRAGYLAVLSVALLACERGGIRWRDPRLAQADTAAGVPDTVVRRVYRVYRKASAMQRVTGEVHALRALETLDSILAVRVLDQRGIEMGGVRVLWSLSSPGDGAALRVINARTDDAGVSRVAFTPGSSASPQAVIADVTNVGRIFFVVTVAVASLKVDLAHDALWSGETDSVAAELRDDRGTLLSGGAVVWATTDSTVARITVQEGPRAYVLGRLAGSAEVVAWIEPGTVRGRARVRVKPVLSGRFITLDGGSVPSMDLQVHSGARADSVPVIETRFSSRLVLDGDIELRAVPRAPAPYHAVRLRVSTPRALQEMTIALVPTRWRIGEGRFAGRDVAIDAAAALRRSASGAPFWRLAPLNGRAPTQIVGWPESALPLRLAFNRDRSREPITAQDSLEFWKIADQMERDVGQRLFAPTTFSDQAGVQVVNVEIGTATGEGHTFVTWNDDGDAYDGVVMFRRASTLRSAHIVTHELLHLLGFGHTIAWPTVSRPVAGTEPGLTPEDVAYAQVAMQLRRLQRQTGARAGLPVANQQ